jgi:hypothetical protein
MYTQAFYNPGLDGGIEASGPPPACVNLFLRLTIRIVLQLTDRVPDVTAPTARYPFEV